ncbi:MAG: hypothetical protein KBG48_19740 [Kofleriaceae bacterium]|nr:hypothetical protein [Kofleriaceae bacterium]MBP9859464.1 hypothetical protein [Kofleriaceae bacterium]
MKRLSAIALLAASFTFAACKKEEKKNAPAPTETKPAAGTAAPAAGTEAPAAGTAAPAAGTAAPAAGTEAPAAGTADPAAGSAAAGGTAPAGTAPADPEMEATMKQLVGMLGQMASAVDAAGGDCGKLAGSVEKVLADNSALIEKMKVYKDNPEMQKKSGEWMQNHMGELMGPGMKVAEATQKCATDPKFAEAMKKMAALQ